MKQLEEVLKRLEWNSYEIKAYCALVEHGASKVKDLAFRSKVPEGKIYTIMSQLEKRGAVIKAGSRPRKYDAQNPRYILEQEQKLLEKACGKALTRAEQAWEIRNEKIEENEKAWQVTGISGIVGEIRRLLEANHTSVLMSLSNLEWVSSKDIGRIKEYLGTGRVIKIVILNGSGTSKLYRMVDAGINIQTSKDHSMNFCVFDHKIVIWISGNYEVASVIVDEKMAILLEREFEKTFKKGSKPGGDRIAS
ncbi:MAG: helix-turn-helix domain-containing protein [Candidatus Hydrothermarchaeales archaeon]